MLGRAGTGALIATLATAVAAQAANPMPGQTYEGPGPKGGSEVLLVTSSSGARVKRLSLGFERGCRRDGRRLPQQGSIALRELRIRGGRFEWKRTIRYPSTGAVLRTTLSGQFVDSGARFTGTLRERLTNPRTRIRCDSGRVRFDGSVPERALVNGRWSGTTAQGRPLDMTITGNGVEAMAFEVTLTCGNGEQLVRALGPLAEPASVADHDLRFQLGSSDGDTHVDVTGTARRELVSGTINATDAISRPAGAGDTRTYSCTSGDVAFQARRS